MKYYHRLKRYDIVEIIWLDSWAPRVTGWVGEHECSEMKIKTIGIFWEKTKNYIYTYGSITVTDKFQTLLNNPFNIPVGCIESVRVIK